ncbi:MAG: RNA 2',3'-cyclic phosphodiesterase [Eubacteriales bacterium]|nr:RNA 2',3'-cyclic phosphodiesterase [Eubacteriales bacterium]
MRLFVGIEINDEARAALSTARASWERSAKAKFCDADLYHLTLAFIGNVEPERLGDLKRTLGKVRFRPFSIKTGQADRFEKGILFAGVQEPNEGLSALQSAVAQELREDGWAMEDRPYHPHITMAWQAEEFGTPPKIEPVTMPVRRFALFESAQVDGRFCYTPIAHWEARDELERI